MRGPAQLASYAGSTMVLIGLVLIGLAWNGAASVDFVQGQLPYVLSGGLPGIGLVLAGMGLLLVQALRSIGAERSRQMAELNASVDGLALLLRENAHEEGGRTVITVAEPPAPIAVDVEHESFEEPTLQWAPVRTIGIVDEEDPGAVAVLDDEELIDDEDIVIAGRSSFHRPECRLVAARGDLPELTRADAEDAGLAPCRICRP